MGLCRQNEADVQLTVEEYSEAMVKLLELNKKYNGRLGAQAGPQSSAEFWSKMEDYRKNKREEMPGCGYLRSCGGVFSKMSVSANGVMSPMQPIKPY